jgi:hypothetical protein
MTPTPIFNIFKNMFPNIHIDKYRKFRDTTDTIYMENSTGHFIFKYVDTNDWCLQTTKNFTKGEKK